MEKGNVNYLISRSKKKSFVWFSTRSSPLKIYTVFVFVEIVIFGIIAQTSV